MDLSKTHKKGRENQGIHLLVCLLNHNLKQILFARKYVVSFLKLDELSFKLSAAHVNYLVCHSVKERRFSDSSNPIQLRKKGIHKGNSQFCFRIEKNQIQSKLILNFCLFQDGQTNIWLCV